VLYPLVPTDDPRYDGGTESHGHGFAEADWVPVSLPKGGGIIFNGYLLHRSGPNTTEGSYRRSFANHYCSAASLVPWTNDQRFQVYGEGDLRDFVMVHGRDPYEGLKPRVDVLRPFLRDADHKKKLRDATGKEAP
jgi:hypothetical protein